MRILLTIILSIGLLFSTAQNQQPRQNELQTNMQLALQYYNGGDYEKAAPLLLKVYDLSKNSSYFRLYLNALIELKRFDEAEEKIRNEIKKLRTPSPEFTIHWGYVLKARNKTADAEKKYDEALRMIPANPLGYASVAGAFMQWQEYEWALKTYLKGRDEFPDQPFSYELARIYLYLRNYEMMMEEYLNLIRQDESNLQRVESTLSAALRIDIDQGLHNSFRSQVLKRMQEEPNVTGYNRLLIWFLLQEKQFAAALRQSVALDRRTGTEDAGIFQLGQMALNNKMYRDAENAFRHITEKGKNSPLYLQAFVQNTHASYLRFTTTGPTGESDGQQLADQFKSTLEMLGYSPETLGLTSDYARLMAFYLKKPEEAITILERGLQIPRLKPEEAGVLKADLADIYVYQGDSWEATLLYSQVIDANKDNLLGDEVKLKKAKLGYYMGNFSWAKAQLDVLKASTSKLTANDAMELSMLIGSNLNLDTIATPLQMFARADLLFFRNKDEEALAALDSIAEIYPYHSLSENILFRKAKIEIDRANYELAAGYLQEITDNFSYGLLADDALFLLAGLCNDHLNRPEEARDLYRLMLTRHPGSIFTEESRAKYRELRETHPDPQEPKEELFFHENVIPDEIN